jgi:WS/DGAT/MGAT family acyltransferase
MSNADAAWFHMDRPTNLMVVTAVLWLEQPIDRDRMRALLRKRLVERFPHFRQRVVEPRMGLGMPFWEDDPAFDLDRHLHELRLPAPGGRRELQALAGELMATPLDRSRPLWETYMIDGYGDGTALISRMHHRIADGIALTRVLISLTDGHPDAGVADAAEHDDHGLLELLATPAAVGTHLAAAGLHEALQLVSHPRHELASLTADGNAVAKLVLTRADESTVFTGELGVDRKVSWSDSFPLDSIKAVGLSTGTTVNDVVIAALTGALHRYLVQHDSLVGEIRAMVPFNLRPLDEPLPRELGNRFGLVYLSLPVGIEDSQERLSAVHRRMDEIKHSPEGAISYGILSAIGLTPPQVEQRLLDVFSSKTTAVMTNVPGARAPVSIAGATVSGVIGWVPTGGTGGMGVSIFSYAGGVTVGFQVDAGLVPDPETIVDHFEHEMATLGVLPGPRHRPPPANRLQGRLRADRLPLSRRRTARQALHRRCMRRRSCYGCPRSGAGLR